MYLPVFPLLRKLFGPCQASRSVKASRRPRRAFLQIDQLEARCVPAITVLASFNGYEDGYEVKGPLALDSSGDLFGIDSGVTYGDGAVFEVQQSSGTITTSATFNGTTPVGSLFGDSSGNLFGTTRGGVFELQQGSGTITTLATFNGTTPTGPLLLEDSSGNLFGTTSGGVFELQQGSGTITTLASFPAGASGANALVEDASGNLFGTAGGGGYNDGVIFEVQKGSGTVTPIAAFNGANGASPQGTLVEDASGNLFGTTYQGGPSGFGGTVFEVQHGSGTITMIAAFNGANGVQPAGLIQDSNGDFFGTTYQEGPFGYGTVFELQKGSSTITTVASFNGSNGAYPSTGVIEDSSGNLFGTTAYGGASNDGTVFELPAPVTITTLSLPNWTLSQPGYSQTINVTAGIAPYTFALTSGSLPSGLTLSTSGVLSGTPTAVGSYNFTVTATDADGASASQSYSITVSPGPLSQYLVAIAGSSTVQTGVPFVLTVQAADQFGNPITSYTGPATVTASISPTIGATSFPATVAINSSGFGFFLANLQKVGSYTITTASGTFTGNAAPVTVTPGAAAGLAFSTQPVSTPTGVTLPSVSVQVVDAYGNLVTTDNSDTVTLTVASGPGSFTAGSTTTAAVNSGVANFNNLTLVAPGGYKLSAVLPEHYIASSAGFTVLPLQVVPGSFAAGPSGISLQFNAPFLVNLTTPVLYGTGFNATAPVPSVTLTQTLDGTGHPVNNPVAGSLVLNTATNTITFLATNTSLEVNNGSPLLPDGTYTVVVHSSAASNGFQALDFGGGFLDGLGTGTPGSGDFMQTFLVNAAADDVVWVPDVAEGPGHALNAPGMNQAGGGYPVYLSDTTGTVTDVQVTLTYNPALLNIKGVTGPGFSLLLTPGPGVVVVRYSGPPLPTGTQTPIGFLTAMVPSGTAANPMQYRAKDLLHLSGVSLNGGGIPVVTTDALHLVTYVGDADGNGSYSNNDAVLITRVMLQADSGFAAYPLVDPVIVADTDGAGFIPADAPLQANEAGVGFPTANLTIPPIPPGVHFRPVANNAAVTVNFPTSHRVETASMETVNIDNPRSAGSSGPIVGWVPWLRNRRSVWDETILQDLT